MSNLEQFYTFVQTNQQLQEQLGAAKDRESFNELAVQLGQENGYTFSAKDVDAFINQKSQETNAELSNEELEAVAGGKPGGECPGIVTTVCFTITDCWTNSLC
ncbi:Nif11-like leader peptide family RiPP precursor [Microcoleus sp. herbarium2]|uniref:Nif11-like leader peptide family RiPP precursor n=1 Tax=Microcoleus sp. herbarium2 TaxID=3055433 RepID=UPI002FD45008